MGVRAQSARVTSRESQAQRDSTPEAAAAEVRRRSLSPLPSQRSRRLRCRERGPRFDEAAFASSHTWVSLHKHRPLSGPANSFRATRSLRARAGLFAHPERNPDREFSTAAPTAHEWTGVSERSRASASECARNGKRLPSRRAARGRPARPARRPVCRDADGTAVRRSRPRLTAGVQPNVPIFLTLRYGTTLAHPVHGVSTPGRGLP